MSTQKHMTAETLGVPVAQEVFEQKYVYENEGTRPQRQFAQRSNRPVRARKRSSLTLIMLLIVSSLLIVVYVWNKISVNRLMEEVGALEVQHRKIVDANNTLGAEINQKSRLERIEKMAMDIGMIYPKEPPVWFEVDLDQLEERPSGTQ